MSRIFQCYCATYVNLNAYITNTNNIRMTRVARLHGTYLIQLLSCRGSTYLELASFANQADLKVGSYQVLTIGIEAKAKAPYFENQII
ncbi:hypothetical protein CKAN_01634400 [Cinnamomum micranthum f. kanehirae]|uniref:Uncharacterized protein n=1 Tax=Cinnamomum micranthum f. kanehirae TaxID=337451 RepID=A0A443P9E7_9MAGN|nr:hypothetical protein CKAN_01634400 [Cinnamomum micranthum f. kanehirae]